MILDIKDRLSYAFYFRLKASLEKAKIDHEDILSQQKKEQLAEVKVLNYFVSSVNCYVSTQPGYFYETTALQLHSVCILFVSSDSNSDVYE